MRKSNFLKHLEQLDEGELKQELLRLYDKLVEVRHYYKMELGSSQDRSKIFEAAKKDISSKYATKSFRKPRRPRIQKIQKILRELDKKSVFTYEMIDVYLYDVECALTFARKYDYFTDVLYNNISKSFSRALELIEHNMMLDIYKERCNNILQLSRYISELNNHLEFAYKTHFEKN